ncbi:MAG: MASE1 domain-containing protein [bacterium]|nr:MASE1 domain-containing protein [bacterium]
METKKLSKLAIILINIGVAGAYFVTGKFGLSFASVNPSTTAIWIPTGIAIAVMLYYGYRFWPAIFIGAFLINITTTGNIFTSLGIATGNTLEGLVAVFLLNKYANGVRALERPYDIVRFVILAGLTATLFSATIGTAALYLGGLAEDLTLIRIWRTWWLGDFAGALIAAPLLMSWFKRSDIKWPKVPEFLALAAIILTITIFEFNGMVGPSILFLLAPFLVWLAFKFSQREISIITIMLAVPAIIGTISGSGPFVRPGLSINQSLLILQAFLSVASVTLIFISTIVEGYRENEKQIVKAHKETTQIAENLKIRNHKKTRFINVLGHELRNPLATILVTTELLQTYKNHEDNQKHLSKSLDIIWCEAKHINRYINDLLDTARIGYSKLAVAKEKIDLRYAVKQAILTSRAFLKLSEQKLSILMPKEPLKVLADKGRIEQIVVNLLHNASKYSDRGSTIKISVENNNQTILVKVQDNGIGISSDMLTKIFDLFDNDHLTDSKNDGFGIGLTLSKALARLNGGEIYAYSDGIGRGSEFILSLPALTSNAPKTVTSAKAVRANQEYTRTDYKRKIMVVDDNKYLADVIEKILQNMGYETRTAYCGAEALLTAPKFKPDVMILDLNMPLGGLEVAKRIKNNPDFKDTRIIALSGYEKELTLSTTKEFSGYLVKPVNSKELRKALQAV